MTKEHLIYRMSSRTAFVMSVAVFCLQRAAADPREEILDRALAAVENVSKNITELIPSFHYYTYDGHPYDIHDGGYGMYDGIGNKVYHSDGTFTEVLYDYNVGYSNYNYGVRSDHPFFGLMWIQNRKREYHTYRMQIEGYPGHGHEREVTSSNGEVTLPGVTLRHKTYQVYGPGIPSICELYFTMENGKWQSKKAENYTILSFKKNATHLKNSVILTGRPKNMIMGYMLLSTINGTVIPSEEIEEVLKVIGTSLLDINSDLRNVTEEALLAIEGNIAAIRAPVSNWYNYTYTMQEIQNGGGDMYGRAGNRIYFSEDHQPSTHVYYGIPYRCKNVEVISRPGHPFVGLMWIKSNSDEQHFYTWQVTGFAGKNQVGVIEAHDGLINKQHTKVQYHVFSLSSIRDHPSICEVYFSVSNSNWKTNEAFTFSAEFGSDVENLNNTITVKGNPQHLLVGYLLLSKKNAASVTKHEVEDALSIVVDQLEKIKTVSGNFLDEAIQSIEDVAENITSVIDVWHDYLYDEGFYVISYEPKDMYNPFGNSIIFEEDLDHASYNRTSYDLFYSYHAGAVKCKMGHPFVSLFWIDSEEFSSYSLKVHSHADLPGTEKYVDYIGSFTVMGTVVEYYVFQLFGRPNPSICEVYFTLSNTAKWSSELIDSHLGNHFDRSHIQDNYIYLIGNIRKIFMGYMLLSKYPGNESITEDEVKNSLFLLAQSISTITICNEETLTYPYNNSIMVTFPRTDAGTITDSNEVCEEGTTNAGTAYGSRKCGAGGEWEEPNWISSCDEVETTTKPNYETDATTGGAESRRANRYWIIMTCFMIIAKAF